ncbi:hypothetical protein FRB90_004617 [Tulasnella sp. 427]|nr:hypothetical protein FRB90_004617 [Tulasnella sp. 427]
MAPALETSIKASFPNQLPSPVRVIVDIHRKQREATRGVAAVPALDVITEIDDGSEGSGVEIGECMSNGISADSLQVNDRSNQSRNAVLGASNTDQPTVVKESDEGADISEALRKTSARFLISDSPLRSTSKLASPIIQAVPQSLHPDYSVSRNGVKDLSQASTSVLTAEVQWLQAELLKAEAAAKIGKSINEVANAQLILRDLHLGKLMQQLHAKEEAKVNQKWKRMASKNTRWLTGAPFMNELRGIAEEGEAEPMEAIVDQAVGVEGIGEVEVVPSVLDPLPGETKTKWRARERAE